MTTILQNGRLLVVEVSRSFPSTDRKGLHALSRRLLGLLEGHDVATVLVDLTNSEHFGAGLVGVLVRVAREAARNSQDIVLCGLSQHAMEVLRLTRLDRAWSIYPTLRAAMRELGANRAITTIAM
jgi:anti-anti-sigma factor